MFECLFIILKWGRDQPFFGITWVQFFQIEQKPARKLVDSGDFFDYQKFNLYSNLIKKVEEKNIYISLQDVMDIKLGRPVAMGPPWNDYAWVACKRESKGK